MLVRIAVLLAWVMALPALGLAQTPAIRHPAPPHAASVPSGPALIDVNSADEKTLDSLPGVGPVRAKAIIANRPYTEKQELVTKKALPANVLADIQDKIALVNVNSAPATAMAKILPNVGPVRAQKIVDSRPFATLQDLVAKGALTPGVFAGLHGLITTGP